jgi:hypothetical protein
MTLEANTNRSATEAQSGKGKHEVESDDTLPTD